MINTLITDINKCLDNDCYMAALITALTIPDICGKAAYPEDKTKKRYTKWFDENIGLYEKGPKVDGRMEMPYLSGEIVYSLRCCLLHQGNPNIENERIYEERCKINFFELKKEKQNGFNIYCDKSFCSGNVKGYQVSVRRLCNIICWCAESYYEENKEKFNFFDYKIVDDSEFEKECAEIDAMLDKLGN